MRDDTAMNEPDRYVRASDLIGASEVARLLGYASGAVIHQLRRQGTPTPAPVAYVSQRAIWDRSEVITWGLAHGRARTSEA